MFNNRPLVKQIMLHSWKKVNVAQSCLTLCDPMDYTVHGILQARILEWVASPFSRGSSQPGNWTQVSHTAGRLFTVWATRKRRWLFYAGNTKEASLFGVIWRDPKKMKEKAMWRPVGRKRKLRGRPKCKALSPWVECVGHLWDQQGGQSGWRVVSSGGLEDADVRELVGARQQRAWLAIKVLALVWDKRPRDGFKQLTTWSDLSCGGSLWLLYGKEPLKSLGGIAEPVIAGEWLT